MKKFFGVIVVVLIFVILTLYSKKALVEIFFKPTPSLIPTGVQIKTEDKSKTLNLDSNESSNMVVDNLKIPWELVFLPNGEMLITERPGNLLKIGKSKSVMSAINGDVIKIEGVSHIGEGGLLGLTIDPKFSENKFIYLYSTTGKRGELTNRVERYKLQDNALTDRHIIISGIKGSPNHDGGRIKFGPDGYLYISTGDAENPNLAQDTNSLNGKILRVDTNGIPAPDNPFGNAVFSYGHRNIQGIAWDKKGNLWATEHGPSGSQTGNDEINLIKKGANYGWPTIKGTETKEGLISPILESGKNDTWAPSGIIYFNGVLFFAGLRGEALYQAKINPDNKLELKAHLKKQFGRIRNVTLGPDNYFYILTNNTDGRGTPKTGDDKLIRINPSLFF